MLALILSLFMLCQTTLNNFLNYYNEIEVNNSEVEISKYFMYQIVYRDDNIYYIIPKIDDDCSFQMKNISKSLTKEIKIYIPDSLFTYECSRSNISSADINKDTLIVLIYKYLLIYKLSDDSASLINIINLNELFNKDLLYLANSIKIKGNKLYGMNEYYHTKRDSTFYYWCYDIKEPTNSKFIYLPEPKGYYWTLFQPRQIMDVSENEVITTDITEYSIRVENLKNGKTDTLTRTIPNWLAAYYPTSKFKDRHPGQVIEFLQNDTSTISTMNNIQFIDDNRIFVCYSFVNNDETSSQLYDLYYDIWERVNGKWLLTKADIDNKQFSDSNENKAFSKIGNSYYICNGKMISTHYSHEQGKGKFLIREFVK